MLQSATKKEKRYKQVKKLSQRDIQELDRIVASIRDIAQKDEHDSELCTNKLCDIASQLEEITFELM